MLRIAFFGYLAWGIILTVTSVLLLARAGGLEDVAFSAVCGALGLLMGKSADDALEQIRSR